VIRRQLLPALLAFVAFTLLVGGVYPLVVTGLAQLALADKAEGSLIRRDGVVVGSRLLGQAFEGDRWFQPRPSAAGDGYDGLASSASNLGPTNPALLDEVARRIAAYRRDNGLDADARVPVDAVTASGSGLDPDISIANARLQAPRVARARGLSEAVVLELVEKHTSKRTLGFMGEERVNVLELNLALDAGP
jgi:K+-transporting ATPase ATPase C chain